MLLPSIRIYGHPRITSSPFSMGFGDSLHVLKAGIGISRCPGKPVEHYLWSRLLTTKIIPVILCAISQEKPPFALFPLSPLFHTPSSRFPPPLLTSIQTRWQQLHFGAQPFWKGENNNWRNYKNKLPG